MLADAAARRVQRPAPLRQAVYDAIVELIVHGTLQRGQHLVENELAEYLGVSRQPVREALQRLQTDGWIDLRPAQGAFVHTPSEDEVDQLLGVRTVLETYSARLAAEHATPEDVNRLWELQQDGLDALAANDSEGLVAANAALHASITALAGNTVLARAHRTRRTPVALVLPPDRTATRPERLDRARRTDQGHRRRGRRSGEQHHESAHGADSAGLPRPAAWPSPTPSSGRCQQGTSGSPEGIRSTAE